MIGSISGKASTSSCNAGLRKRAGEGESGLDLGVLAARAQHVGCGRARDQNRRDRYGTELDADAGNEVEPERLARLGKLEHVSLSS